MGITADTFRRIALSQAGAIEASHMKHPDFRIGGRIFASLGYPDESHGMVKLTPDEQAEFIDRAPAVFEPSAGAWGRAGCTNVNLQRASRAVVEAAVRAAALHQAAKQRKSR